MCYTNFTQHSGCGHIGESNTQPLTLCDNALQRLYSFRGPNSPPISPREPPSFAPPKRSASTRRFLSLSRTLSRTSSRASRTTESSRATKSASSNFSPITTVPVDLDYASLPVHQINAVRCAEPIRRSQVASDMDVCPDCRKALTDMRNMLERYDKTGSIRGTTAFEQFLRFGDDRGYVQNGDVTIPAKDGAMQAIVMGHADVGGVKRARAGTWERDGDGETLSDHVRSGNGNGPRQAQIMGHPSDASLLMEGGTHGLGYWRGDDVSSLATSKVFS